MSEFPTDKLHDELGHSRPQPWVEILQAWQEDEERPNSRSVYMQNVGQDWLGWRNAIILPLHLDKLEWNLYTITDPAKTIPHFRGGPFTPWQELYYGDKETPTFEEIVTNSASDVQSRDKFRDILSSPEPLNLIGIIKDDDVYIVEGMHRCVAIALAACRNQPVNNEVRISLAVSNLLELPKI